GFRTSHEINTIEAIDEDTVKALTPFDAIANFKARALTPSRPTQRGTAQNEDIFFQAREASNRFYNEVPKIVESTFKDFYKLTGRKYSSFEYYGAKDAESVVIAMGSGADTVIKLAEALAAKGEKVGAIKVRLYRPFDSKNFITKIPITTKIITVLDRTKESGATYEPLALDVISALAEYQLNIRVLGGRYGLSSKEFTPSHAYAVYQNMYAKRPKDHFTVGIDDDVTFTSLDIKKHINLQNPNEITCKFFGLGSDGTVSANKNTVKIIGEEAKLNGQAYFVYDSKKSGSVTTSHMRLSHSKIVAPYLVEECDFIACHNKTFLHKFHVLKGIKKNGTFLLNASWSDKELDKELPDSVKKEIADKNLRFYIIDAESLASRVGLNRRINLIMQTAFFALSGILPMQKAITLIKDAAKKSYGSKGEHVLQMNITAIDNALNELREVKYPSTWKTIDIKEPKEKIKDPYYTDYIKPILTLSGDNLKVSSFNPTGEVPTGTTAFEKRNVATALPCWNSEKCIECNQCALVCPHACIRPYLVPSGSEESKKLGGKPAIGVAGYDFVMQVSPMDCTGCGNCANVCPAKDKALTMVKVEDIIDEEIKKYNLVKDVENPQTIFKKETIKGSQFEQPLFEFSGACAGCGETPYIKLLTQLYGKNLIIANATGCSSIYGGSSPTCPYTKDKNGYGPAWANSLFEDNAEFGLGIKKSADKNRETLEHEVQKAINEKSLPQHLHVMLTDWLPEEKKNQRLAESIRKELERLCKTNPTAQLKTLYSLSASLFDSTVWIIGGDGWAYDIGFGGLDHVLHSNEKIRILVLDTEVYSNTGGQASKATPMGATAKFASGGKTTNKKDLGAIAMNYPNVYVASVSLGANMQQTITALKEAEEHNGPSIVIAYCPCINHGTDLSKTNDQQKDAVLAGYWNLYRYNPNTGLTIDPPAPNMAYVDFIKTQSRYFTIAKTNPETANRLFQGAESYARNRLNKYVKLAQK
ncbi:MAG: pyruvate:ferredoxin (flavodoxin) oxidoreductase, partial [Clostridia bacterium]|nr:pyruvate:ferredoxin (flavodoxin) oxidoreductase [Clostridia bacterium]